MFLTVLCLSAAQCLSVSSVAFAQTDEQRAGARAAANQGADAFDAQRWQEAVDLFQRAESLVHSPIHWLYLARSLNKLGRLVEAREYYMKISREPVAPGAPPALTEAKAEAEKEGDALEARFAHVTIQVQGVAGAQARVTVDGKEFASALLGVDTPIDPGTHNFEGKADGFSSQPVSMTFSERGKQVVTLTFTPAAAAAAPPPPPGPLAPAPAPVAPAEKGGVNQGLRIGSYVAFGVGAIGIGGGTFFLLKAKGKSDDAAALCKNDECPVSKRAEIDALDEDAKSARNVAIGGFVLGGVGVAAGVTLFLLSRDSSPAPTHAGLALRPVVGPGYTGLAGSF